MQLIVTPIDPTEKGSHRLRRRLVRAAADLQAAQADSDLAKVLAAETVIEQAIAERAHTDDGSSVLEALELVSEQEFIDLARQLLSGDPVPNTSGSVSPAG